MRTDQLQLIYATKGRWLLLAPTVLHPLLSVNRDSIASRMSSSLSAQPQYIAAHLSAQLQYRAAISEKQAYEAYLLLAKENGWVGIASRDKGTRIEGLV